MVGTDEDGPIEVGKVWVQKMFEKLDSTDKSFITLDQLEAYIAAKMLALDFTKEKLQGMFTEAQTKKDGRLTLDELVRATSGRFKHRKHNRDWYRFTQTFFPNQSITVLKAATPRRSGLKQSGLSTLSLARSTMTSASGTLQSRGGTASRLGSTGRVRVKAKTSRLPPKEDPGIAPSKEESYVNAAVKSQLTSVTDDLGPVYPTVSFEAQKRFSALTSDMETRSRELNPSGKDSGAANSPLKQRQEAKKAQAPLVMPEAFARLRDQEADWHSQDEKSRKADPGDERFVLAFHTEDMNSIQTRVAKDQGAMRDVYRPPAEAVFRDAYRPQDDGKPEFMTKFHKEAIDYAAAPGGDWDLRPKFAIEAEAKENERKARAKGEIPKPKEFITTFPPRQVNEDLMGTAEDLRLPLDLYQEKSTADFMSRKAEKLVDKGLPRMELNFRPLGPLDRQGLGEATSAV